MKKYKSVIFDIDGTILDTAKMNLIPLMKLIKEEKNKDMDYEDLLFALGLPGKKTLEQLGFENVEKSYEKWVRYVNEYEEGATLYTNMDKVIKDMHSKNVLCGIVSSKNKSQYEIDFMPTGLHDYMNVVILEDDTKNHKPHPEPLEKIIKMMEIDKESTIYIGDSVGDYKCAKACNIDFGLASWGAVDAKIIDAQIILEKPEDLLKFI
ncbi:HAD family hydrolase [Romboutsia lituseburensis]|uniref:HAD family hydrolase n=1 Tax=Romboutsia lituseburensis TaxID=1537 RepID=UPI0022EA8DFE|nr:HAD family hydrolase [Romboutsia lituseburensis]